MTRSSGFSAQAAVEVQTESIDTFHLPAGNTMTIFFKLPDAVPGERLGFGGWFAVDGTAEITISGAPARVTCKNFAFPDWGKVGSQWVATDSQQEDVTVKVHALEDCLVAFYGARCGIVENLHYASARPALLENMHQFAPEANTYVQNRAGDVAITSTSATQRGDAQFLLYLKSCNRCGRFLPINVTDERAHLSFSNHCVAAHRRPCQHSGFGRVRDANTDDVWKFEYGFQLECRFCKKFEVNAAHNPLRSTAQMKEDAQRRRAFELLLEHLYEGSDQLRYRHRVGRELASDIFERFDGRCFKCATALASPSDMNLDHTRPLALLWPLDETATALCPTCNSEKRDRPPSAFYTPDEIRDLSYLTGLTIDELNDPGPNMEAIALLAERADWFCNEFLQREELQEVRDGKLTADLLLKALDKVLARVPGGPPFSAAQLCADS